jgi:tRNA-Thr(GGU) m(6)t(6)A37 methyltransferase TsaA
MLEYISKGGEKMKIIAKIHTDFKEKFGIPRQSTLYMLESKIIFEPEYRNKESIRGIEGFSHLWLIWNFSESERDSWSPTVRPPRLGGNKRMGVFATRSPFRPNPIGLSSVRLLRVEDDPKEGPVLIVSGADMLDGSPIYDIKPYLAFSDSHPNAAGGFSDDVRDKKLDVDIPSELLANLDQSKHKALVRAVFCGDKEKSAFRTRVYPHTRRGR